MSFVGGSSLIKKTQQHFLQVFRFAPHVRVKPYIEFKREIKILNNFESLHIFKKVIF